MPRQPSQPLQVTHQELTYRQRVALQRKRVRSRRPEDAPLYFLVAVVLLCAAVLAGIKCAHDVRWASSVYDRKAVVR